MTVDDDDRPVIEFFDERVPEFDWFLQTLVDFANDHVLDFPITLFLGGMVVTGNLISGRVYFEEWADMATGGMFGPSEGDEDVTNIRNSFADLGRTYPKDRLSEREEAGEDILRPRSPQYIHIRDAKFFVGTKLAPTTGKVLWRGRLSMVSGFTLGTLAADEP